MLFGMLARSKSTGRKWTFLVAQIVAILSVPMIVLAFPSPPAGLTGATGDGTCASCHSGSMVHTGSVSVTFPGGLSYTPGVPQQLQVTVSETGKMRWGFELTARTTSNIQAGSLAPIDSNTQTQTSGAFQDIAETSGGTQAGTANTASWSFTWTPPATNVGNVVVYVDGLACDNTGGTSGDDNFTASYTLTPASPPMTTMLTVSPAMLSFTSNGIAPPQQTFHVTSSGAATSFTTSVSTASGGSWLSALPSGGTTPLDVTVSADPTGLATGTYMGTVMVTASGASNSPQSVGITLHVTAPPPVTNPALALNPSSLTFNSANGGSVAPQNVKVTTSGSALSFNTSVSTNSGGNWLSVSPSSGSTGSTVVVSAAASGLSSGTYTGSVTFTSSGASNSPQTLGVTLMVGSPQPPSTNPGPMKFDFGTMDKQSNGNERLLLDGQGIIDNTGQLTGGGKFNRFTVGQDDKMHTVSMGSWKAKSVISFSPATISGRSTDGGRSSYGGILEIAVDIIPMGGTPVSGTMRIANTGTDSGVTLAIIGGTTFVPTGTGHVSLTTYKPVSGTCSTGDN